MPGSTLTRKKIRDNVKALLLGNTDAGNNVFISRVNKPFLEELPAIFIYTGTDTPRLTKKLETNYYTVCDLVIECVVSQNDENDIIQDQSDILAGQVQDIIDVNPFLQDPPPKSDRYALPAQPEPGETIVSACQWAGLTESKADQMKEDVYGVAQSFACEYYFCKQQLQNLNDFNRFGDNFKQGDTEIPHLTEIPTP